MSDNLVIVESPAKAKTIAKYLNQNPALSRYGDFKVMSSMGHIRDLDKKDMGIDVQNDFKARYVMDAKKQKVVRELKSAQKDARKVWLASDFDREGEAIAMHLKYVLGLKCPLQDYARITFTEITPKALERAIEAPRDIDYNLVDAQETRRVLDRLVGFSLSPVLWKNFSIDSKSLLGMSAGRVQSAVLHMVVEKEREIEALTEDKSYWHVLGDFTVLGQDVSGVHLYQGKTIKIITNPEEARQVLSDIQGEFYLDGIVKGTLRKNPELPYITSSLQQDAYNKLGFPMKKAMKLAQDLYEAGHITYMRTDSYNLSDDFKQQARSWVQNKYGTAYVADEQQMRRKRTNANAQEAHEAIRPTCPALLSSQLAERFSGEHKRLYDLIWKRALASQMAACVSNERKIKIKDKSFSDTDMYFSCTCSRIFFPGYMIVYGVEKHTDAEFHDMEDAQDNKVLWHQLAARHTWSSPPARYNESSMVRLLEKEGIGRPSTYASIMTKLFEKQYVTKKDIPGKDCLAEHYVRKPLRSKKSGLDIQKQSTTVTVGKENNKVVPTPIGIQIDAFLSEHFAYIVDKAFTANMEGDLDKIAQAQKDKLDMLKRFWDKLEKDIQQTTQELKTTPKIKCEQEKNVIRDEETGVNYTIREAKYGPVIAYELSNPSTKKKEAKYIPLKGYLATTKKDLFKDISLDDIQFLQSFPHKIGMLEDGQEALMAYGPYGFYARIISADTPDKPIFVSLPPKTVQVYLDTKHIELEDISQALQYKLRPDKPKRSASYPKKRYWGRKKK